MNDNDPFGPAEQRLHSFIEDRYPDRAAAQRTIVRQSIHQRTKREHVRFILRLVEIALISRNVRRKLFIPELWARCRNGCVPASLMSVPEAAMDEDHGFPARQDNIRAPGQFSIMKPVSQAERMQRLAQGDLRPGVGALDACHHP